MAEIRQDIVIALKYESELDRAMKRDQAILGSFNKIYDTSIQSVEELNANLNEQGIDFNEVAKATLKNMSAEQKSIATRNIQNKALGKLSKNTQTYRQYMDDLTKSASGTFRVFLPLLFGFQNMSQSIKNVLDPAMELVGVNEVYQNFLAVKYLPTALKQLDRVLKLGDAWGEESEASRELQGDLLLTTIQVSEFISYLSQMAMMFGAIGEVFPTAHLELFGTGIEITGRQMGTFAGLILAAGSGLAVMTNESSRLIASMSGFEAAIAVQGSGVLANFTEKAQKAYGEDGLGGLIGMLLPENFSFKGLSDTKQHILNVFNSASASTTRVNELGQAIKDINSKTIIITTLFTFGITGLFGYLFGSAVKKIFGFQYGGIVPGPLGSPIPAIVHGGEEIVPANKSKVGTINLNVSYSINVSDKREMEEMIRENNKILVYDLKRMVEI